MPYWGVYKPALTKEGKIGQKETKNRRKQTRLGMWDNKGQPNGDDLTEIAVLGSAPRQATSLCC